MVLTLYAKQRIVAFYLAGFKPPKIHRLLRAEDIRATRVGIWKFLVRYSRTQCLLRKEGSGRPTKITEEVRDIVEHQMQKDDETTACQLHQILAKRSIRMSLATILRCRSELGWTYRGSYTIIAIVLIIF